MEYKLNINQYGDVVFILENFNKQKNAYYRMHLREGIEQIYREQTATDEEKRKINGLNNVQKAEAYGIEGNLCNYIIKMIKIPNAADKFSYRLMNIFEIVEQYHIKIIYNNNDDDLDS
jgi:hypothetical protein